jgi:hypothetical protein
VAGVEAEGEHAALGTLCSRGTSVKRTLFDRGAPARLLLAPGVATSAALSSVCSTCGRVSRPRLALAPYASAAKFPRLSSHAITRVALLRLF